MCRGILIVVAVMLCTRCVSAQHDHGGTSAVEAPKVFLDKSPRAVAYQLNRLSNERLLLVETKTDDPKYAPVFRAILTREGMSRAYREEALAGLVAVNGSDPVQELAAAIGALSDDDPGDNRTVTILSRMLLGQPNQVLDAAHERLMEMLKSDDERMMPVAYGALMASGQAETAWEAARGDRQLVALLHGIRLIPNKGIRDEAHPRVIERLKAGAPDVQAAAVSALGTIRAGARQTFTAVASLVRQEQLREEAIRTLLTVAADARDRDTSVELAKWLVDFAEKTPPAGRTEDGFLDAMELVEQLLVQTPPAVAKSLRKRLRETVVRVVRIHTVEEEMRYDVPYFAVEAGRPVQIVLINEDLMPHNLVVTQPGALKEVAEAALDAAKDGLDGKQYVPHSDQVLVATHMIPAGASERLTFDAPLETGEYPYVCTFPRHWMRMYGVMVVVDDLDAWMRNPVEPQDPVGSNRQFVQSWTVEDFSSDLEAGLVGRSAPIGERMFVEATCAQCHQAGDVGVGKVGPDLSGSFSKRNGDDLAVLQEILDPSHRIDEKYAVHLVLDLDGKTVSGLVLEQDKEKVVLLENPEAKEPTVILQEDIDRIVKTSKSMMPKGLMDRFTKDEIYELMHFLKSVQK